jgi:hypothetical protein
MNPEFVERFTRVAEEAVEVNGLTLDASGEQLIADLAQRAAQAVDEGDENSIARAEDSFRRLASVVAESLAGGVTFQLGRGTTVDGEHLQRALLALCPGFFPFC